MNGFAVFCAGSGGVAGNPARLVPPGSEVAWDYRGCGGGDNILVWSQAAGDIHLASGQGSFLVLSGYLLGSRSEQNFENQQRAAEWCLARIEENGPTGSLADWLSGLHGSFGIFYRNQTRNLTLCISDRVASRPIWMQWRQSGWIVSSHPVAIALSDPLRRLDTVALGSFLVYGGPVEPCRSLFRGVTGIPPGTIVRLGERGKSEEQRCYRFRHEPRCNLPMSGWVELAAERLTKAASRLVDSGEKMAVFFSGGADSRLAAAALKAAGGEPLLVTLGDSENLEVKIAGMAAKALRLPHRLILRDDLWYLRSLDNTVYETGGNYCWIHGHFADAASRVAKETGIGSFVLGDLCEAFSKLCCAVEQADRSLWSPGEFADAFDLLRLPLYRPAGKETTLSLLNGNIRRDVENGLRREIIGLYQRIYPASADPLIVGDQCLRWDSVQTIPTYFMFLDLRSKVSDRNIMLDADVHELLEILPSRFRNEMNLGALLIRELHPGAAWVVNSNSLLPMAFPPAAHKLARRIKPVLGKVRRTIFGNTYHTTGSWPKHSVLYRTNPEWRRSFDSILGNPDLFDTEFFDRDAIRRCWQAFLQGDGHRTADIERLVQLGILGRMMDAGTSGPEVTELQRITVSAHS